MGVRCHYCHKNIFGPLGLKNISFFPTAEMKKQLAYMNHRNQDGSIVSRDHLLRRPLIVESLEVKDVLNSGGGGCFARPSDYARKSSDVRSRSKFADLTRNHRNAAE
jgi:CubicO group peptidase (beta-lactamase class C family)